MWQVDVSGGGASVIVDGHPSRKELLAAAGRVSASSAVQISRGLVEREFTTSQDPWVEPISRWAEEAASGDRSSELSVFRPVEGTVGLRSPSLGTRVWQEPSTLIAAVPAGATLSVTYGGFGQSRDSAPVGKHERVPILDGVWFVGEQSTAIQFESNPSRYDNLGDWKVSRGLNWIIRGAIYGGLLVARIVRHGFERANVRPPISDPGFQHRLATEERDHPNVARFIPRLEQLGAGSVRGRCVIIVHGTFSCAVPAAEAIYARAGQGCYVRFEHDTFRSIDENAKDLCEQILRTCGKGCELLLLGHSRGGLVACRAAAFLQMDGHRSVQVWTHGTPHRGTPLAGYRGQLSTAIFSCLYRLCGRLRNDQIHATLVEGAFAYLLRDHRLPIGVEVMRPGSPWLESHEHLSTRLQDLRTWGGRTDPRGATAGIALLRGLQHVFFPTEENDLVVPTASALLGASATRLDGCHHFGYYEQPTILDEIAKWAT